MKHIGKTIISEAQLAEAVEKVATEISADYQGKDLTVIVVSSGALFFASDLIKKIRLPLHIDMVSVSSYRGTQSTGTLNWHAPPKQDLKDRDILVIDDILDSGLTMSKIKDKLMEQGPKSFASCVLLDKQITRSYEFNADYSCFEIDDTFVIGYGLDYNELYRNLPFIAEYNA